MGRQHAAACQREGAAVRLLCDPDVARARELAQQHPGAMAHDEIDRIDWSDIDAAFFCTPPHVRGPAECAAAAAGVALFLEKPVALNYAAGQQINAAAQRAGVVTAAGYMNRYRPSIQRAKQLAAELSLVGIACHWVAGVYRVPWWGQRAMSGGQLNEQCTHFIDLVRYFGGEVVEVTALSHEQPPDASCDVDCATTAILRTERGLLATLYASCGAQTKQIGMHLFTPTREVRLEGWDLELRDSESPPLPPCDPFQAEVAAFLHAVRSGDRAPILCDLGEALRTQRVTDAVARALVSRRVEPVEASADSP